MITAALEFIHERKWLVELILLAVLVVGVYLFCQHLIQVGVQRQRDEDIAELGKLQRKADVETGRLQGVADAAEKARAQEATDLDLYRRQHPLHGGLCDRLPTAARGEAAAPDGSDAQAGAGAGNLLALPSRDPEAGGRGDADVRHLLDILEFNADGSAAGLREYQARAQVPAHR